MTVTVTVDTERHGIYSLHRFSLVLCLSYSFVVSSHSSYLKKPILQYLETEENLVDAVRSFIEEKSPKLTMIYREYTNILIDTPDETNRQHYLGNPVHVYALISRMYRQWPKLLEQMGTKLSTQIRNKCPTYTQMEDAKRAILRLQEVYNLSAHSLVTNSFTGSPSVYPLLSAIDCYDLGIHSYEQQNYLRAVQWLETALKLQENKNCILNLNRVLQYILQAKCFLGDEDGLKITHQRLVELERKHTSKNKYTSSSNIVLTQNCNAIQSEKTPHSTHVVYDKRLEDAHFNLCRGRMKLHQRLSCRYVHHNKPQLMIGPFKMEELHRDPFIVMFHDAISDNESQYIMERAVPHLKTAVAASKDYRRLSTTYRTSRSAWLPDRMDNVSARLSRRVAAMTDLSMTSAEANQVASYGLSGEFLPHTDTMQGTNVTANNPGGTRLATFMFYLNNVEKGGYTVFLALGLAIPPRRNSAVFWYNLGIEGEVDVRSMHAGCPVLLGSKWVLNKWIHEGGQTLTCPARTRNLNRN